MAKALMTHKEKMEYMRIATGVAGFVFTDEGLDLLVSIYEMVLSRGGKGSLLDIVRLRALVKERADVKARSEMLDKVSIKI